MKLIITEREKLKQQILYLQETYDVERKFMSILEWEKDAFWDEDSLQLMKEIDGAVRCESYGVVTPIGASCISCLSTGCKFGLIVLHHIKKKYSTKIVVNYWVAGENVWEWLMVHTDATLYILEEDFDIYFIKTKYDNLKIRYRKKWYNSSDSKVWEIASKCQDKPYILTKETENQAYERHCRLADKEIFCDIKEEIFLDKFLERFGKNEIFPWDEQWDEVKDYKVINYCNYIPIEFLHKKHPLYVCGTKSGEMEIFHELTVKYPEFWEVLLYDVVSGTKYVQIGNKDSHVEYRMEYEKWFVILLNDEEVCKVAEYPKNTIMGFEVEPKEKRITILDKRNAIEKFHEICQKYLE